MEQHDEQEVEIAEHGSELEDQGSEEAQGESEDEQSESEEEYSHREIEEHESERPSKKPRLCFSDTVTVLVGSRKKPFWFHKHIVCSRSAFFDAACSGRWNRSSASKSIELPEDDPDIFDVYLYCVYKNVLDVGDLNEDFDGEEGLSRRAKRDVRHVKTYLLADKLGDVLTANIIIDRIIEHSDRTAVLPSLRAVAIVSHRTVNTSPLRLLFVDFYVHEVDLAVTTDLIESNDVSRGFLGDILSESARIRGQNDRLKVGDAFQVGFPSNNKCRYHQHDEELR